jgi:hypothetical protein
MQDLSALLGRVLQRWWTLCTSIVLPALKLRNRSLKQTVACWLCRLGDFIPTSVYCAFVLRTFLSRFAQAEASIPLSTRRQQPGERLSHALAAVQEEYEEGLASVCTWFAARGAQADGSGFGPVSTVETHTPSAVPVRVSKQSTVKLPRSVVPAVIPRKSHAAKSAVMPRPPPSHAAKPVAQSEPNGIASPPSRAVKVVMTSETCVDSNDNVSQPACADNSASSAPPALANLSATVVRLPRAAKTCAQAATNAETAASSHKVSSASMCALHIHISLTALPLLCTETSQGSGFYGIREFAWHEGRFGAS